MILEVVRMNLRRFGIASVFVLSALMLPIRPASAQGGNQLMNQPAPNFTLPTLSGGRGSLSELRGKVVLVNFFASW